MNRFEELKKLFSDSTASVISDVFEKVEVVEELLAAKKRRHPDKAKELDRAFMALQPSVFLQGKPDRIYKKHVEELLARVVVGADLRLGTKAEVLALLLDTSLRTPLKQDYNALIDELFLDLFGMIPGGYEPSSESYKGAKQEIFDQLIRTKVRDPERRLR
jgi:hypothetical protein